MAPVRLATRGSQLALAQAGQFADRLAEILQRPVELVQVTTRGDRSAEPLSRIGGTGVFVAAVREAVLDGRADLCIHSLKDLPTTPEPGLRLVTVPERGPALDALVTADGSGLADLPAGARVGTGSPRRAAQLRAARSDVLVLGLRGNVDSRIAQVDRGDLDAVVLAEAGLFRLGLHGRISEVLSDVTMLPAPGQGALGVEARSDLIGHDLVSAALALDHGVTRAAVSAERAALASLEAGCTAPMGALAQVTPDGAQLSLVAGVFDPMGDRALRESVSGPLAQARELGQRVAERLLAGGAAELLAESGAHPESGATAAESLSDG